MMAAPPAFLAMLKPRGDGGYLCERELVRRKELPSSPTLRIAPGKPVRAVCITPSQVLVNEEFTYDLRLEDR